jgi:hypothetical protein
MKTIITAILALLLNASLSAQIVEAEGFFDTDPGVGNGLPLTIAPDGEGIDFSSSLPTSISSGIHTLYVRTRSASNLWSVPRGRLVVVDQTAFLPPEVVEVDRCEYFIDADPGVGNGVNIPITLNASVASITESIVSSLSPGFYRLSLRFRSTEHVWSVPRTRTFYVRTENDNQVADEIVEAEYFIDAIDPGPGNASPLPLEAAGDPVDFVATAATNVAPGIHALSVRFKSSEGLWSVSRTRYFNVIDEEGILLAEEIVAAEYFVDADPGVGQGSAINLADPGQTVQIATEALMSAGLGTHILYLRTKSDRNIWSVPRGRAFIVTDDPLYPVNEIIYAEYFFDTDPGESNGIEMAIVEGSIVPLDGTIPTTGLNPGPHTLYVRVLSNLGIWSEIANQDFVITSDTPFFDIAEQSPACSDTDDGEITVEVFGGTSTYTYTWDGVVGTETLSGVPAGDYHLVVTDAENEVVLDTVITMTAPAPLTYEVAETGVSCNGLSDGEAVVTVEGGTGTSTIDWNGADPSQLGAGTYNFTITDENGCELDGSAEITEPAELASTSTTESTSTSTSCDGSIAVDVSGGTPPYSYDWTPDAPDSDEITDLCTGSYSVIISDANECTYEVSGVLITVGVSNLESGGVVINTSPNPGNGLFQIEVTSPLSVAMSWQVLDAQGRLVMSSSGNTVVSGKTRFIVDLTTSANGVYFMQMKANEEMHTIQLIIEK